MPRGFTERRRSKTRWSSTPTEVGWNVVSQAEQLTLRKGEAGLFFYQVLRDKLIEFNPNVVTESNVDEVIKRIESARASIEGNEDVLLWLRGQRSVYVDEERREINVRLIDFDQPDQQRLPGHRRVGLHQRPVTATAPTWSSSSTASRSIVVETKAANKPDGIDRGHHQIRRYHQETPELLTARQVFDVTQLIHFYYGATWNLPPQASSTGGTRSRATSSSWSRRSSTGERFLQVLPDFILFHPQGRRAVQGRPAPAPDAGRRAVRQPGQRPGEAPRPGLAHPGLAARPTR